MFRAHEIAGAEGVRLPAETIASLADELMVLALVSNVNDHAMLYPHGDGTPGFPVSAEEMNLVFSRDGRYAIFDFEPEIGCPGIGYAVVSPEHTAFDGIEPIELELTFGFFLGHFRFETSGLRDILVRMLGHYAGEDGYRLFRAIVLRSGILGSDDATDDEILVHYERLLGTVSTRIATIDDGRLYSWLRGVLEH